MAADHLYKISWQQFRENITENFRDLRGANQLHDVSLYIDSYHTIGAHKVILCTVSPYFRRLLTTLPPTAAAHPVLLMPKDVTKVEVGQILDFVYYGEVSLPQSQVQRFLDIAEHFEIRGLKEESKTDPNANRQSSPANPTTARTRHPSNTMKSVGLLCPHCNQMCKDVIGLKTHIAESHPRWSCQGCGLSFKSEPELDRHLLTHTAARRPVGSVVPQQQQQHQEQQPPRDGRQAKSFNVQHRQQQQVRHSRTPPPSIPAPARVERKGRQSGNKYENESQAEPQPKKAKSGDIASTLSQRFGGGISVSAVSSELPEGVVVKKEVEDYEEEELQHQGQKGKEEFQETEGAVNEEEKDYYYEEDGEGGEYEEEEEYPGYDFYGKA